MPRRPRGRGQAWGDCDDKNPCAVDDGLQPSHMCANLTSNALSPTSDGNPCTKDMCIDGGPVRERLQEGLVALPTLRATLRVGSAHEGGEGRWGRLR